MKEILDIPYINDKLEEHKLDIYLPDCTEFPVLIYFHGGGLERGSRKNVVFAKQLAEMGICLVSADYRMYPTAVFPEYIRDAAAAVSWVKKNIFMYGNATKIYVGGSSAGGYITQMLCFDKKYLAPYGINPDEIDGYLMDAGQPTSHFNVLREKGLDSRRVIVDETAPLYYVQEHKYAPMEIIVADNDMKNRFEQTMLLLSTLKHFNSDDKVFLKIMENSSHCGYVSRQDEDGNFCYAAIVKEFIDKMEEFSS